MPKYRVWELQQHSRKETLLASRLDFKTAIRLINVPGRKRRMESH